MSGHQGSENDGFVRELTESQTALRSYIWKLAGSYHDTEDILQKTNMVIWDKRMEWDPATVFLKWAYRIAYFQARAYLRDRRRDDNRLVFDQDVLEVLASDSPHFQSMGDLQEALDVCLRKMDKRRRELLLKRYQGDYSVEDLAGEHNRTPNSLSQLLRRLRIKLADCIQEQRRANLTLVEG